jgi:hypothetical protein
MRRASLAAIGALAVCSCGGALQDPEQEAIKELHTRASFDFDCPASQIHTVSIDDRTKGVSGCGQKATYVRSCEGRMATGCTWVLNADQRSKSSD